MALAVCFVLFSLCLLCVHLGSAESKDGVCSLSSESSVVSGALVRSLLEGVEPTVRPRADCGAPVVVGVQLSIFAFYKASSSQPANVFNVDGAVLVQWNDSRLAWDPKQFSGITNVPLPANKIWLPDLYYINNLGLKGNAFDPVRFPALVSSAGTVTYYPATSSVIACNVSSDAGGFQLVACGQQIEAWTSSLHDLDLKVLDAAGALGKVNFDLNHAGDYDIVDTKNVYEKIRYEFLPPFARLSFKMNLRSRKPMSF